MVVCFAVIIQFNSNICMKISHHMSHEFDKEQGQCLPVISFETKSAP